MCIRDSLRLAYLKAWQFMMGSHLEVQKVLTTSSGFTKRISPPIFALDFRDKTSTPRKVESMNSH